MREQEAGKMLYRGAFSVGNPSGGFFFNRFDFSVKGIANTGVLNWGNRLLALYEVSSCTSSACPCSALTHSQHCHSIMPYVAPLLSHLYCTVTLQMVHIRRACINLPMCAFNAAVFVIV